MPRSTDDVATLKATLKAAYEERRDALGWTGKNGQLTKKGADEALSWLVGVHVGLETAGADGLGPWLFIASIRGVDELFRDK